ncbi:putative chromatin regulator PHD family [Helianthus annuus]|nr:putative chromatin regulator PHD family [Helianthus annuus]
MERYKHFSHPHTLSIHKICLEGAQLTCNGCKFPCTNTLVYSCSECNFFLHDQCFNASRSLTHPSHPNHPLSLFPSSTYKSGSFRCNSCGKSGSGFCYCCSNCSFDLHIHCAYNTLNPKYSTSPPNQVELKSHPNHPLKLLPKPPYVSGKRFCNVCGTRCNNNGELYRCNVCDYDAHVTCTTLPQSVCREDHAHSLSLLYVNPYPDFTCNVCRGAILQKHCMYHCSSGCDYGMHVKCVGLIELSRGHGSAGQQVAGQETG